MTLRDPPAPCAAPALGLVLAATGLLAGCGAARADRGPSAARARAASVSVGRRRPARIRSVRARAAGICRSSRAVVPYRPAESPALAAAPTGRPPGGPARRRRPGLHRDLRLPDRRRAYAAGTEMADYLASGSGPDPVPARRPVRHPPGRLDDRLLHLVAVHGRPSPEAATVATALETLGPRDPDRPLAARSAPGARYRVRAASSSTGSGCSTTAQARIRSRLTLSVWVRGKSASGQSRQAATRWLSGEGGVRRLDRGVDLGRAARPGRGGAPSATLARHVAAAGHDRRARAPGRPPRSGRAWSR